jgi:hypothetical protein
VTTPDEQLEVMKVTLPERGAGDTVEMDYHTDKGITFEGPAVRGRLPQLVSESLAPALVFGVYAFFSGVFFYICCKGVALLWHPQSLP